MDRFRLDGKTIAITGASSGFGHHFAGVLAEAGARVVLGATDGAPLMLPAVAERLAASGAEGFGVDEAKQALADAGASFDSYLTQIHAVALSRAAKGAFAQ